MLKYIQSWMVKPESKKNLTLWNSGKTSNLKTDFLRNKNHVRKFVLILIGALIALIVVVKKLKKIIKYCKTL